jgi:hypothetical protein
MVHSLLRVSMLLGCAAGLAACGEGAASGGPAGGGASGANSGGSGNAGVSVGGTIAGAGTAGAGTLGGSTSAGASGASGSGGSNAGNGGSGGSEPVTPSTEKFSFFVTSLKAMQELSGSQDGFGGDLRFGETGAGAGLKGADKICTTIAEKSMPSNHKTWRAFLSATQGDNGQQVDAIDRIGEGPWYDRTGRLVAENLTNLAQIRPEGADEAIANDLPNEDGVPNHEPDVGAGEVDNHDILTGTNDEGRLFSTDAGSTCNDWTSAIGETGEPRCGHSWPRSFGNGGPGGGPGGGSGENWMSALDEAGCAPGVWLIEAGPPGENGTLSVGDGGGYGGIYCFALTP